jgi:hypothetical protein
LSIWQVKAVGVPLVNEDAMMEISASQPASRVLSAVAMDLGEANEPLPVQMQRQQGTKRKLEEADANTVTVLGDDDEDGDIAVLSPPTKQRNTEARANNH